MNNIKRLGFCCKWIDTPDQCDGIKSKDPAKEFNTIGTTVAWLNRQTRDAAEERLWHIMKYNIEATRKLVRRVGGLDESLRMLRISSDILPVYTEPTWSYFWRKPDVIQYCEEHFKKVGDTARQFNVRLSMHPGQFTVLASENDEIVNRSIEEFEYHADMARWMGYGQKFQDFKINVHIAGRRGPEGIRTAYNRLSTEARNCITIENEEITHGVDDCLSISDLVPIVLDIHHHWCREGEYIEANDSRIQRVVDSWRGVRPTCHYSVSREDTLFGHSASRLPNLNSLLESGHKMQKLRAHSDFYWNDEVNLWALTHLDWADLMCEAKAKNLASRKLYEFWQSVGS